MSSSFNSLEYKFGGLFHVSKTSFSIFCLGTHWRAFSWEIPLNCLGNNLQIAQCEGSITYQAKFTKHFFFKSLVDYFLF